MHDQGSQQVYIEAFCMKFLLNAQAFQLRKMKIQDQELFLFL